MRCLIRINLFNLSKMVLLFISLACNQYCYSQQESPLILQDSSINHFNSIEFSSNGNNVIGVGNTSAIVWNANTGERLLALDHQEQLSITLSQDVEISGYVETAVFSPDDRFIVTGSSPLTAILWNAITGDLIKIFKLDRGDLDMPSQTPFTAVGFTQDGSKLLTSAIFPEIHMWDVESGDYLNIVANVGGVNTIGFFNNDTKFYTIGESTLKSFNLNSGEEMFNVRGIGSSVSKELQQAFIYTEFGLQSFDLLTGEFISANQNIPLPDNRIPQVKISPNGNFIAIGKLPDSTKPTQLFETFSMSDTPVRSFNSVPLETQPDSQAELISFAPDNSKIAIRYLSKTIVIYDLSDLENEVSEAQLHNK